MRKTILITGSTDGIGLLTAKNLAAGGHKILLHGRSTAKLDKAAAEVGGDTEQYVADLSSLEAVNELAQEILVKHQHMDILINNAGVLKTPNPILPNGQDVRFVVNTIAPYILTKRLLPIMPKDGRVVNLSSAAQAPVNPHAMLGEARLDDMGAYAQSKLAITIWTQKMAQQHPDGPVFVAVNPGSLLASKMVKEGFGVAGNDLSIGADVLRSAALSPQFAKVSGRYFDNDSGQFSDPHPAARDTSNSNTVMQILERFATAGN